MFAYISFVPTQPGNEATSLYTAHGWKITLGIVALIALWPKTSLRIDCLSFFSAQPD